jgi:predicted O-methyltransferase YrrM
MTLLEGLVHCLELAGIAGIFWYVRAKYRVLKTLIERTGRTLWSLPYVMEAQPKAPMQAPNEWTAGSDFLAQLASIVLQKKPRLVVELGSGLSTIVIGSALRRNACGRVVAIDHDADYASKTKSAIAAQDLLDVAEVRTAPLAESASAGVSWYATAQLVDLQDIDLLVVDGPPATDDPQARFPALPYFWERLREGATVILDDASRAGETEVLTRWQQQYPGMALQVFPTERGCVVLTKSSR